MPRASRALNPTKSLSGFVTRLQRKNYQTAKKKLDRCPGTTCQARNTLTFDLELEPS